MVTVSSALDSEAPSNLATALTRTFRTYESRQKRALLTSQLSPGVLAVALRGAASSDAATKAKPRSPAGENKMQQELRAMVTASHCHPGRSDGLDSATRSLPGHCWPKGCLAGYGYWVILVPASILGQDENIKI